MSDDAGRLIAHLLRPDAFDHEVAGLQLVETHISWVILTGRFAYKIKKPVALDFVDFSTPEKRRVSCEEEIRINRRLAPALYLGVVPICGTPERPEVNGSGPTLEHAVKMAQFDQSGELDLVLERGGLEPGHMTDLARQIAAFHERSPVAVSPWGTTRLLVEDVLANFEAMPALLPEGAGAEKLDALREWSVAACESRRPDLDARKARGFVRECHGDLHLANLVLIDGRVVAFDAIEFSERLRWIDVTNEIAFLVMDLESRQRGDLGFAFLDEYLQWSGDCGGLKLLGFYVVYRAMVRAKVTLLRARQVEDTGQRRALEQRGLALLELARRSTLPAARELVITRGFSGSGKTWFSRRFAMRQRAIRVCSDVERKRLHGLRPDADSRSTIEAGIYDAVSTAKTYDRLAQLARSTLEAGFPVVVDASFLHHAHRERFARLAADLGVPFSIRDVTAPVDVLRQRIVERGRRGDDASEADLRVLEHQQATCEALRDEELAVTQRVDTA